MMAEYLTDELKNWIGRNAGLQMWDYRDLSKTYSYPGARDDEDLHADDYYNGVISEWNGLPLLNFLPQTGGPCTGLGYKSVYTINLATLRPTASSPNQTLLTDLIKKEIRAYRKEREAPHPKSAQSKIKWVVAPKPCSPD